MEIKGFSDLQAVYRLRPEACPKTSRRTGPGRPPKRPFSAHLKNLLASKKRPKKALFPCDFFL